MEPLPKLWLLGFLEQAIHATGPAGPRYSFESMEVNNRLTNEYVLTSDDRTSPAIRPVIALWMTAEIGRLAQFQSLVMRLRAYTPRQSNPY
jgi:hypothetical protein